MPKQLTCQHGHQWEAALGEGVLGIVEVAACPVCGATAMSGEWANTLTGPAGPAVEVVSVPGYDVLGEVGRGGMGIVYRAWHTRLKRLVALKMIQPSGSLRVEELTRFRTEAEAGAALQHPNIVQVFDIGEVRDGTERTCPYLACEYVDGGTLALHLAGAPQPANVAGQLVETLARAIQHAHQRGVIHRDLKPANILLSFPGLRTAACGLEEVTPKIADFGLAKQLGSDTLQTHSGAILGTPSYMAPEQTGAPGEKIGPWTDIYGLGAILYEMLTGRPPFRGASALDTVEQVRHQEPVAPSRLQPRVPRDLETITLKCLRKEPSARYRSALELADDLERFREGEPIRARPVSGPERVWRWGRRNPALAALSAVLLATLFLGNVVGITLWRRAETQRGLAEQRLQDARQAVHEHFVLVSETQLAKEPGTQALQKQLWESALGYFRRFAEQDGNDRALRADVAEAYYRVGLLEHHLGSADRALAAARQAETIYTGLVQANRDDARSRRLLGSSCNLQGVLETERGRFREAQEAHQRARVVRDELAGEHPEDRTIQREAAATRYNLGMLFYRMRQSADALAVYQDALASFERLTTGENPGDANLQKELGQCRDALGVLYKEQLGQPTEALRCYQQALAVRESLARAYPAVLEYQADLAASYNNLGVLQMEQLGQLTEAQQALQQALTLREQIARANPSALRPQFNLADTYTNLGIMQVKRGAPAAGLPYFEQALAVRERLAHAHPESLSLQRTWATGYHNLGRLHADLGQKDVAIRYHEQALALRRRLAQEHPNDPNLPGEVKASQKELLGLQAAPSPEKP